MTHEQVQELLGAYAIDAVDGDEAQDIDAHLTECPRCRADVGDLREVAALLAHSGADAPDGVWDRIASSLGEAPPPLRLDVRRATRGRPPVVTMIAIAAAAAVIVVLAVSVLHLNRQVDDLQQ